MVKILIVKELHIGLNSYQLQYLLSENTIYIAFKLLVCQSGRISTKYYDTFSIIHLN